MTPQELGARLLETVAAQREDIVDLCADLVAAPSVHPVGDTREVADVVTQALRVRGIPSRQEHFVPAEVLRCASLYALTALTFLTAP